MLIPAFVTSPLRAAAAGGRFPRVSRVEHAAGEGRAVFVSHITGDGPTPTRTTHAPAAAPHAAALRTRAPTGLVRPEMAVQTRTAAARNRRVAECVRGTARVKSKFELHLASRVRLACVMYWLAAGSTIPGKSHTAPVTTPPHVRTRNCLSLTFPAKSPKQSRQIK